MQAATHSVLSRVRVVQIVMTGSQDEQGNTGCRELADAYSSSTVG